MKKFLSSLLLALTVIVAASPAFADDPCKNLFDISKVVSSGEVINNGDGTLTVKKYNSWPGGDKRLRIFAPDLRVGDVVTLSAQTTGQQRFIYLSTSKESWNFGTTRTITEDMLNSSVSFYAEPGSTDQSIIVSNIQIERGDHATSYSPYTGDPLCATCDGTVEQGQWNQLMNGTKRASWSTWNNQISNIVDNAEDNSASFDFSGGSVWNVVNSYSGAPTISGHKYFVTTLVTSDVAVSRFYLAYVNVGGGSAGFKSVSLQANQQTRVSGITTAKETGRGVGFEFKSVDPGHMTVKDFQIFDLTAMFGEGAEPSTEEAAETAIAQRTRELGISATNGYYEYHAIENVSYCRHPIKIATTAYNNNAFSSVQTALNNAVTAIKDVVANTITQAAAVQSLQTAKQTMPDASDTDGTCPRFRQCLLIQDPTGKPHWFPILDPFRDFVTPIIENGVTASAGTHNAGYTQLEYIESTGTQRINTGVAVNNANSFEIEALPTGPTEGFLISQGNNSLRVSTGRASWFSRNYHFTINYSNPTFMNFQCGLNYLKVDGTDVTGVADTDNASGTTVYLFAINTNAAYSFSKAQVRKFKIWDGNSALVRDFVPVRQNSTGKYGMYDLVNGVFYGNTESSGDDFTPGPEVINQDPLIPGMTWTATWNANSTTGVQAGTVNGVARCTSVTGTYDYGSSNNLATGFNDLTSAQQTAWNTPFTASTLSNYTRCWCKVTSIDIDNDTVVTGTTTWRYYGTPRDAECSTECAARCEYQGLQRTANFGKALFEQ